jgi:hypothetical protein
MNTGLGLRITLHADGLPGTLPRARVGGSALAAHWQTAHVADTAIALDALQALKVHTQLAAEIAFDHVATILDCVNDLGNLLLRKVFGAHMRLNLGGLQDGNGVHRANAINVTERDINALLGGDFDTNNTWHMLNLDVVCGGRWCKSHE